MAGQVAMTRAWDGVVDAGIEQRSDTDHQNGSGITATEVAAHALLRLVAERPGHMGRERAARIVGGFAVTHHDDRDREAYEPYAVARDWRKKELVDLVDALIGGGLLAQTVGVRPLLVLTRAGHHALNALEGAS